jgi:hypothetical protein
MHLVHGIILIAVADADIQRGFDYKGHDLPHMPLAMPSDDLTWCKNQCENISACVGYIVKPTLAVDGSGKKCSFGKITGAACWLKTDFGGRVTDVCRIAEQLKPNPAPSPKPPSPPTPPPPPSPPPAPKGTCTINVTNTVSHLINPLIMGCHSDSGYAHEPRALYSQMIFGASFEACKDCAAHGAWPNQVVSPGVEATLSLDQDETFNGGQSQKIIFASGTGRAGIANRGLGNEGLVFEAGKPYEGYLFAKANHSVTLTVSIEDHGQAHAGISAEPKVLATQTIKFKGGNWTQLPFNLTPSASTSCIGIDNAVAKEKYGVLCPMNNTYNPDGRMSDRTAHICVACGGQFTVALSAPGEVNIDFVYLQPGAWGRCEAR